MNIVTSSRCRECNDLSPQNYAETAGGPSYKRLSPTIRLLDLQRNCRYCSLLHKMAFHFAPDIQKTLRNPCLNLELEEGCAANVEVAGYEQDDDSPATYAQFYLYLKEEQKVLESNPACCSAYSLRRPTAL